SRTHAKHPFALTVAAFAVFPCISAGQFAVNQFGYVGGGFRRYLLLPAEPGAAFRAGSYLFVTLGLSLIPLGGAVWCVFSRTPFDVRTLIMLMGVSTTALFLFHSVAVWTSILGASRGNFYHSFGNDLSLAGNATLIGSALTMVLVPTLLGPGMVSPDHWWATPPMAAAAAGLYFFSLRSAAVVFRTRRERLMAMLEGRG
ncbi:MAG TPA: hypothetical protein VME43_33510, partial [Bryobacteraceae bacterium]|nr:hypothetical protein [Bryobacteraceae bacterium]